MEELYLLKCKNTQKYVGYSEISKKYVTSDDVNVSNLYNYYFNNKMIFIIYWIFWIWIYIHLTKFMI